MQPYQRSTSAPPYLSHRFIQHQYSATLQKFRSNGLYTTSRTPSISSSSSSRFPSPSSDSILFKHWDISPPTRRQSVTEGIEPYVDPERYDPRPARKCLVDFRPVIWQKKEKRHEPSPSPLMSPKGTEWIALGQAVGEEVSLRDKVYEAEERRERREEDEVERVEYAMIKRKLKREARRREKMEKIRLAVAEWEKGKARPRPGNGVLECDRDVEEDEEEGELGSWLDIALQRSKFQRQISPERSILGDGPGFNYDESTSSRCYSTASTMFSTSSPGGRTPGPSTTIWERDGTQRLKRVSSAKDLRVVNKRYDLDAESAYSQSIGTLAGESFSRSLIDFPDESYKAWNLEGEPLNQQYTRNPIRVNVAARRAKEQDGCSQIGHLWHRRKRLSAALLQLGISVECNKCHRRAIPRRIWACLVGNCQSTVSLVEEANGGRNTL